MGRDDRYHGSRRQVLRAVTAGSVVGVTGLAGCVGDPEEAANGEEEFDTIELGVLEPFTGPFADLGEERTQGTELAIEEINESDEFDFEIEYETYDTQSDPEDALSEASEAVQSQGAQFLTGCISSDVALSMNDFALDNEVLYTPGAADVAITGERCNEYVFRFETSTAQIAEAMAQWTYEEQGDQIFYHLADYAYGESVKEEFSSRMAELSDDYEEVGETRAEFGAGDFEAYITQIEGAADEADAVVIGSTGEDLTTFLSQAADRGLPDEIPIVTTTASFTPVRAGAGDAATGVFSGVRYYPDLEMGDNHEFVEAYEAEYDELPDNFSRVGYDSIRMMVRGIQEAGSDDPTEVADALGGLEQETIFGSNEFRECDGQAVNPVWMGELVEGDDLPDVEILMEIDGEEAIPACEETGCER
ncbi:ABC transporter substrate-binding protein [Natronococcus sp. A-GB1]|uniref:ABC transporter substrate-binding protein n=1 Tax=Natronococcus sp. A-GB1 TaxID=3037648 RepID=UPI00241F7286|nr:ABC transporter substrate-binding protein [Natronococcus sp. A-GB1]MDG5761586.1 ABC transporter substrate-binding protein [Natronococcus sp. A-GB1]